MSTIDEVRSLAVQLPRSYEALVGDRVKFRVGRIVYLAFSRDETMMGFAFPKEEREDLVASEPEKFLMPVPSDMRYNWVVARLERIDDDEMREIVVDAWRMPEQQRMLKEWILTAKTYMHVDDWVALFREVGYTGDYYWFFFE